MVRILKKRIDVNHEKLLAPLSSNGGVGEYLRFEPIYDQIREARKEDDDTLSQGIWKTDLKKADWVTVESLCAKALEFQTKDLQIAGWMTESWIVMDRFKGLIRGFDLISDLLSTYWQGIYPEYDDPENRVLLFDWMTEAFTNRVMLLPLTTTVIQLDKPDLHLADWMAALSLETLAKRENDYNKFINKAESSGQVTLNIYRRTLAVTDGSFLQRLHGDVVTCLEKLDALKSFLGEKLGKNAPTFSRLKTALDDISRLSKITLEQRDLPLEIDESDDFEEDNTSFEADVSAQDKSVDMFLKQDLPQNLPQNTTDAIDGVVTISGRKDAYAALKDIGGFLHTLDPHSPAPYLLDMIVAWEDKTLPEILEDLSNAPTNTQMLIRLLASSIQGNNTVAPAVAK